MKGYKIKKDTLERIDLDIKKSYKVYMKGLKSKKDLKPYEFFLMLEPSIKIMVRWGFSLVSIIIRIETITKYRFNHSTFRRFIRKDIESDSREDNEKILVKESEDKVEVKKMRNIETPNKPKQKAKLERSPINYKVPKLGIQKYQGEIK